MCSKAEEKSKVVCKVCGSELELTKKNHYVVTDNLKTGIITTLTIMTEEQWYDAFDCPVCGCQYIAGERKRKVRNVIFRELQEDLVSDNVVEEDSFAVLDELKKEVYDKNPDYPLPSCFGKELSEADEECIGCKHLTDCFNASKCFGEKGLLKEILKGEQAAQNEQNKAYPICIGDQALIEENGDGCQKCDSREECIRRIIRGR